MPRVVDAVAQSGPFSSGHASILKSPATPRAHSKHVRFDVPKDAKDSDTEQNSNLTEPQRRAFSTHIRRRRRRFSARHIDPDYIALHNASLALESQSPDAAVPTEVECRKRPSSNLVFSRAKRLQLLASSNDLNFNDSHIENCSRRLEFKATDVNCESSKSAFIAPPFESSRINTSLKDQLPSVTIANQPDPTSLSCRDPGLDCFDDNAESYPMVLDSMENEQLLKSQTYLPGQVPIGFRSVSTSANSAPQTTSTSNSSVPNHFPRISSQRVRRHSWRQIQAAVASKHIPFCGNNQSFVSPVISIPHRQHCDQMTSNIQPSVPIGSSMPAFNASVTESCSANHAHVSYPWRQLRHAVTKRFAPVYRQMLEQQPTTNNVIFPGGAPAASALPSLQSAVQAECFAPTAGGNAIDADDESGSSISDCAPGPLTVGADRFRSQHTKRPAAIFGGVQPVSEPPSPSRETSRIVYSSQVTSTESQTDPIILSHSDACVQSDLSALHPPRTVQRQYTSASTQTDIPVCLQIHPETISVATGIDASLGSEQNNNLSVPVHHQEPPKNSVARTILFHINKSLLRPWT